MVRLGRDARHRKKKKNEGHWHWHWPRAPVDGPATTATLPRDRAGRSGRRGAIERAGARSPRCGERKRHGLFFSQPRRGDGSRGRRKYRRRGSARKRAAEQPSTARPPEQKRKAPIRTGETAAGWGVESIRGEDGMEEGSAARVGWGNRSGGLKRSTPRRGAGPRE